MARYRTIKPELFSDGSLSECCREARFLFVGLLPFVDDMGRRRYSAKQLKNEVFPGDSDIDAQKVGIWFHQLVKAGVVELYEVKTSHGSADWFRLPNFLRHQKIMHPTHVDSPQSPTENGAPQCLCDDCRRRAPQEFSGGLRSTREASRVLMSAHESSGILMTPQTEREREVVERESERERERTKPTPTPSNQQLDDDQHIGETKAENRRARQRALDGIATQMLVLLKVQANPLLLDTLTKSITTKARTRNTSLELAGQHILAKAALYAVESPPEDWQLFFEDVRYEYVPKGDKRINNGHFEARPVCGGSRCSDGWEMVKVGETLRLRRCPDCEQLWKDLGV